MVHLSAPGQHIMLDVVSNSGEEENPVSRKQEYDVPGSAVDGP